MPSPLFTVLFSSKYIVIFAVAFSSRLKFFFLLYYTIFFFVHLSVLSFSVIFSKILHCVYILRQPLALAFFLVTATTTSGTIMGLGFFIFKCFLTSAIVVSVSEVAKRYARLGGLLVALPIVTVLTLIWLQVEGQSHEKIARHAWYTLWYVLPTLPTFLSFPYCFDRLGFYGAMAVSCVMALLCFGVCYFALSLFGIYLISST